MLAGAVDAGCSFGLAEYFTFLFQRKNFARGQWGCCFGVKSEHAFSFGGAAMGCCGGREKSNATSQEKELLVSLHRLGPWWRELLPGFFFLPSAGSGS